MVLELIQAAVGVLLFFAAGYAVSLVIFREKDLDPVERIAYSLAFSLVVPALVLFAINYALGFKVFQTIYVYIIYALIIAASFAYAHFTAKPGKQKVFNLWGFRQ